MFIAKSGIKVSRQFIIILLTFFFIGCHLTKDSTICSNDKVLRNINPADISLPSGYKIEMVSKGLNFPGAITFDNEGVPYILEKGCYTGEGWSEPRLLKLEKDGSVKVIAKGGKNGPWNGITFYKDHFYIAEGGHLEGGRILQVSKDGKVKSLIEKLPSWGDYQTNGPVVKDDFIYFGQGTATNNGVVGTDSVQFSWLKRNKSFHDIPCQDLTLLGNNFDSYNLLTSDPKDKMTTGAFSPYGITTKPLQVVKGKIPCSGAILRIPIEGGEPELVSWGLRNPTGLSISPDNKLYITENSFDEKGNRPSWSSDVLWEIKPGLWYGWPDYSAGRSIKEMEEQSQGKYVMKPVLEKYPNDPPKPVSILGKDISSKGLAFSISDKFGYNGEAFIAEFGGIGKNQNLVGFKVIRVNVLSGSQEDFITNKSATQGPASKLNNGGLERPADVKFSPDGNSMYIVDFGMVSAGETGPVPVANSGVLWKVTKE